MNFRASSRTDADYAYWWKIQLGQTNRWTNQSKSKSLLNFDACVKIFASKYLMKYDSSTNAFSVISLSSVACRVLELFYVALCINHYTFLYCFDPPNDRPVVIETKSYYKRRYFNIIVILFRFVYISLFSSTFLRLIDKFSYAGLS